MQSILSLLFLCLWVIIKHAFNFLVAVLDHTENMHYCELIATSICNTLQQNRLQQQMMHVLVIDK